MRNRERKIEEEKEQEKDEEKEKERENLTSLASQLRLKREILSSTYKSRDPIQHTRTRPLRSGAIRPIPTPPPLSLSPSLSIPLDSNDQSQHMISMNQKTTELSIHSKVSGIK